MKIGSLFAGIGGIELGFEQAEFETVWANEIDADACKTYRKNFPNVHLIEGDVRHIDASTLSYVDVLTAGFPCQPFSVCGQKKGFNDARGNLFFEIMRIADEYIDLLVQDNGFPAEIGKMGNGLQMWLQIIWFLARSKDCEVIILDEPDVYMHPDMQRKIVEMVQSEFPQIIIATHSAEIISRVNSDNILEINKADKKMHYASDSESVQRIIDDIGSIYNLSLLNLGRQRRCLFVEGQDEYILNLINEQIYGRRLNIPTFSYGGFYNINRLYGASNLFYKETDNQIKCYALADKDYRDTKIIDDIILEAKDNKLNLHIWSKKEIENYLLIPSILYEFVPQNKDITYDVFCNELEKMADKYRDSICDSYADQYYHDSKALSGTQWAFSTCNTRARDYMTKHWTDLENKLALVCGKDFLSEVFDYFKLTYNISLSKKKIIDCMTKENISKEMFDFLCTIN